MIILRVRGHSGRTFINMISNSRKYERNACFYLWLYRADGTYDLVPLPIKKELHLPVSDKLYKTTLKNVKVYINELLQSDNSILRAELERATHIGSFERKQEKE